MDLEYYYNITPQSGKVRNNLIYTSMISKDKKTFVKWYYNDTEYHQGMNQIVDPNLMDVKWNRELFYLTQMSIQYPNLVPQILDIDELNRKIYLKIDDVDFWQRSLDRNCSFDDVLPDWQEQMLEIFRSHKSLGWYKYSLHPSSYFIIDGQLKSINYFFTYSNDEPMVTLEEHRSHISFNRQEELESKMKSVGIDWNTKVPFKDLQLLCFESFRTEYPSNFIDRAKELYAN